MLKRKVYSELIRWKEDGARKALNLIGARQTGKSTIAREFGNNEYAQLIELNFIQDPQYKEIFRSGSPEEIYTGITSLTHKELIPGNTLLLLDEIQECPAARTAIKFLVEDHRADIIETGSLLGVSLADVQSYPVGFEEIIPMYPMTLEEFLWAMEIPQTVLEYLKGCFESRKPVNEAVHQQMLSLFYLYMAVGGMPEAVQTYVSTKDMARVLAVQKQILSLYRLDIGQYTPKNNRIRIQEIFDSLPGQLNAKNKRFKLSKIDRNARTYQFSDSFLWLEAAGVALPCYNVSEPVYPLQFNEKRTLFKLYLCDTGLLCPMSGGTVQYDLLQGRTEINNGSLMENVFAQCLKSRTFSLFYYDAKSTFELDFLVENDRQIDIVEIKSGKYYRKHASLSHALEMPGWNIHQSYVFCQGNVEEQNSIVYLPFYMIMFYEEPKIEELIWKPDLSALMNFN